MNYNLKAALKIPCRCNQPGAVVLGMGPTALALVRALGRKGVPVYGIGLSKYELSLSSRYCKPIGVADPRYDPDKMLQILLQFGRENVPAQRLVLYPTGDECVAFIGESHIALSKYYRFARLDPETVELFLDKGRFYEACLEHGLPSPLTFLPNSVADLRAISEKINYPCIVKPKYYHKWAMQHGLVKGVVCHKSEELLAAGDRFSDDIGSFIIQEIMDGPETDIYVFAAYFDRDSNPHGIFTGQKIRQYPVGFGTTTMMKTADKPELVEMSVAFLRKVGYQGLCDVEYKYDRRDNIYKIIEINARLGRWYGIVEAAGHDTIFYGYLDLTNQTISDENARSREVTWVLTSRDIPALLKGKDWSFFQALRSYRGPKTWCVWAADDMRPFFAYPREILSKIRRFHRKSV